MSLTPQEAKAVLDEIIEATVPRKQPDLTLDQIENYYNRLYYARNFLLGESTRLAVDRHLDLLRREIDSKRIAKRADRHHGQMMRRAGWTLFWAAVGGIGTIGLLLIAIPLPKLFHAMSSQWRQPLETKSPSMTPSVTQSPSVSPTVSPQPTTTK